MPAKPPTPADHLGKAEQNKKFGLGMISTHPTSAGWALTALFYSAVHFSEAYFLKIAKRITNHQDRFDAIRSDPTLRRIYGQYMHLYDYSYNARYTLKVHGKADVEKAKPSLEAVEQHFKSLL
jgi:hypothetical protein